MGFRKSNVVINKLGIEVPEAYAQIHHLSVDLDGECSAMFKVQTSRESMNKPALDMVPINITIDKEQPIHKQVYEYAKAEAFADWEDDIVE